MPNQNSVLAFGSLNVDLRALGVEGIVNSFLSFRIHPDRILFYDPQSGGEWGNFTAIALKLLPVGTTANDILSAGGPGQITIDALPASPLPAFYGFGCSYDREGQRLELQVEHVDSFARSAHVQFSKLNLSFVEEPTGGGSLQVTGGMEMQYRDVSPLQLTASVDIEEGLLFSVPSPDSGTIVPDHSFLRQFDASTLKVASGRDRWDGLQALYTFDGGGSASNRILEYSGVHPKLHMNITGSTLIQREDQSVKIPLMQEGDTLTIVSGEAAGGLVQACRASDEVTIEVWLKPEFPAEARAAEIVSVSSAFRLRHVMLGQGRAGGEFSEVNETVVTALLRVDQTDRLPTQSFDGSRLTPEHTHLVLSRDKSGITTAYINGEPAGTFDSPGPLDNWEEDAQIFIATDPNGEQPWAGELFQLAVYDRALTADQVKGHFFPRVFVEGEAFLNNVPAPLDQPLAARWVLRSNENVLEIDHEGLLTVFPHFFFEDIDWQMLISETGELSLSGNVAARLWGNSFSFIPTLPDDENAPWPILSLASQNAVAVNFGNLAALQLGRFTLTPEMDGDGTLGWLPSSGGDLTFADIPEPVGGPTGLGITFPDRQVWLSIVGRQHNFLLLEHLLFREQEANFSFGDANLRFGSIEIPSSDGQWTVTALNRIEEAKLQLPALRAFSESHLDSLQDLVVGEEGPDDSTPLSLFFGRWSFPGHTDMRLAFGFHQDHGNGFSLEGELQKEAEPAPWLRVTADGQFLFGSAASDEVRLAGTSRLTLLDEDGTVMHDIFSGETSFNDDQSKLMFPGEIHLFPAWSDVQVVNNGIVEVGADGIISLGAPVKVSAKDFELSDGQLLIDKGDIQLLGNWLGKDLAFQSFRTKHGLTLQTTTTLDIPFQLFLGPIFEPSTGAKIIDNLIIGLDEENCPVMEIKMDLELTANGFKAKTEANFTWIDENGHSHDVEIPQFQLLCPPRNRNELLEVFLNVLRERANTIFAPQIEHREDYFLREGTLFYLPPGTTGTQPVDTVLPPVFAAAVTPDSSKVFSIVQEGNDVKLIIDTGTETRDSIRTNYLSLLRHLEEISAPEFPKVGATRLIRGRIAERLPMPLDEVLFYYYGFEPANNRIDLHPGCDSR